MNRKSFTKALPSGDADVWVHEAVIRPQCIRSRKAPKDRSGNVTSFPGNRLAVGNPCPLRCHDTGQTSWGNSSRLPRAIAGSTLPVLDEYGLRKGTPARPTLVPHIRFLFIDSRFCSTLLSDPPSPERPCASLTLHLHQVG